MTEPYDIWWRAEDRRYADYDPWAEWEQPTTSHCKITLHPIRILRATPAGVVAREIDGSEHFIKGTATKQYAVPTKELALRDLMARKQRQRSIYEARARNADEAFNLAARMREKELTQK